MLVTIWRAEEKRLLLLRNQQYVAVEHHSGAFSLMRKFLFVQRDIRDLSTSTE